MPQLVSNLVEKKFTPYTAKLAPEHTWARHNIGRKPQKVWGWNMDPTVQASWRFVRRWICQNHKLYYTGVMLSALIV